MNELNSKDYYCGREQQERKLADTAGSPAIAAIHRDMAQRYALLIEEAAGVEGQHTPRLRICA